MNGRTGVVGGGEKKKVLGGGGRILLHSLCKNGSGAGFLKRDRVRRGSRGGVGVKRKKKFK